MLQEYTTALETNHLCNVCSEAVTNPICPFCLTSEIDAWLTLYPSLRKELMPKLNNYLNDVSNKITTYGTQCIKCKKNRAFVCPYCFTEYVFRQLEKMESSEIILKEFLEFFNFDLDYKGYFKDSEEEEVVK